MRLLGSSLSVARASGVNVPLTLITTMIISGGLSGLAGMMEISGLHHRLLNSFSPGYGFTAVVVALLGNLNPRDWPVLVNQAINCRAVKLFYEINITYLSLSAWCHTFSY